MTRRGEGIDRTALEAHVRGELQATAKLAALTAEMLAAPIAELAVTVVETLRAGGKLLFCGNGGSAADAQHLAAEYVVRYSRRRGSLPAVALTTDSSVLTAGSNDFGFEQVFARQIEGLGSAGDVLILHSTSGASVNLLEAARAARQGGLKTAALLAKGGGALAAEVDLAIVVPTDDTARAQEMHLAIGHAVTEWVDRLWAEESGQRGEDERKDH